MISTKKKSCSKQLKITSAKKGSCLIRSKLRNKKQLKMAKTKDLKREITKEPNMADVKGSGMENAKKLKTRNVERKRCLKRPEIINKSKITDAKRRFCPE